MQIIGSMKSNLSIPLFSYCLKASNFPPRGPGMPMQPMGGFHWQQRPGMVPPHSAGQPRGSTYNPMMPSGPAPFPAAVSQEKHFEINTLSFIITCVPHSLLMYAHTHLDATHGWIPNANASWWARLCSHGNRHAICHTRHALNAGIYAYMQFYKWLQ